MNGRVGWFLSIALVLVVGAAVYYAARWSTQSAPTEATSTGMLAPIVVNVEVYRVAPRPAGAGAETLYSEAVKLALGNKGAPAFIETAHNPDPLSDPALAAIINEIRAGSSAGLDAHVELTFPSLGPVGALTEIPTEKFLVALGDLLTKAALSRRAMKESTDALLYAHAALIFGDRLWHQGVYVCYRTAGLQIMGEAISELQLLYSDMRDDSRLVACEQMDRQRKDPADMWLRKVRICRQLNNNLVTADLLNMAEHDEDRSWRIEATMWLGAAQWMGGSAEDRLAAKTLLTKLIKDADPLVAQQAAAALDIQREQLQALATQ